MGTFSFFGMNTTLYNDEVNVIIFRHLIETKCDTSAFTFFHEANIMGCITSINNNGGNITCPNLAIKDNWREVGSVLGKGLLLNIMKQALLYVWAEIHIDDNTSKMKECNNLLSILKGHECSSSKIQQNKDLDNKKKQEVKVEDYDLEK